MPISGKNFGVVMLLAELHIQCSLVKKAKERLQTGAEHWIKMSRGQDFDNTFSPLEILSWCTVVLSGMASIRHLVVVGRDEKVAKERRRILLELLGTPALPQISSSKVRDSWEHLDERLDSIIPAMTGGSITHIHVMPADPAPGTIALKRFDPRTLTIYFADESFDVRLVAAEAELLLERVDQAMKRLHTETVLPWG